MQGMAAESKGRSERNAAPYTIQCIFRRERIATKREVSYIVFYAAILRWGAVDPRDNNCNLRM